VITPAVNAVICEAGSCPAPAVTVNVIVAAALSVIVRTYVPATSGIIVNVPTVPVPPAAAPGAVKVMRPVATSITGSAKIAAVFPVSENMSTAATEFAPLLSVKETVEPVGRVNEAVRPPVSASPAVAVKVEVAVPATATAAVGVVTTPFNAAVVALAGTAENPAIANAEAATSAMRLKLVFVYIYFCPFKTCKKESPTHPFDNINLVMRPSYCLKIKSITSPCDTPVGASRKSMFASPILREPARAQAVGAR
jgi:hypothetical protein